MSELHVIKCNPVFVIVLLIALSLACTFSDEVDVDGPLDEGTTLVDTEETEEATETPTEEPSTEADEEPTSAEILEDVEDPIEMAAQSIPELETLTLNPLDGRLSHLGTFRQRLTANVSGESAGNATYIYETDVNTSQQALHITLTAEGELSGAMPSNQIQFIWIDDQAWIKIGNHPWKPVPENVAAAQFDEQGIAAGDFLPYVPTFNRVGEKTVNGVATAHYTYGSENMKTEYGTMSGSGDIYVAKDDGYIVRYTFDGTGSFDNYYSGAGDLHLVYDTYDAGESININIERLGDNVNENNWFETTETIQDNSGSKWRLGVSEEFRRHTGGVGMHVIDQELLEQFRAVSTTNELYYELLDEIVSELNQYFGEITPLRKALMWAIAQNQGGKIEDMSEVTLRSSGALVYNEKTGDYEENEETVTVNVEAGITIIAGTDLENIPDDVDVIEYKAGLISTGGSQFAIGRGKNGELLMFFDLGGKILSSQRKDMVDWYGISTGFYMMINEALATIASGGERKPDNNYNQAERMTIQNIMIIRTKTNNFGTSILFLQPTRTPR